MTWFISLTPVFSPTFMLMHQNFEIVVLLQCNRCYFCLSAFISNAVLKLQVFFPPLPLSAKKFCSCIFRIYSKVFSSMEAFDLNPDYTMVVFLPSLQYTRKFYEYLFKCIPGNSLYIHIPRQPVSSLTAEILSYLEFVQLSYKQFWSQMASIKD